MRHATRQRTRVSGLLGERILSDRWMRRLSAISFLGTLDRHPRSKKAFDRFAHSLAVAELGALVARDLELARDEARPFVAACLLHDVGHYPWSHAAEPAFAQRLGANHHQVTSWILRGGGPIARANSMRPALEAAGLDPELVWSIIDRSADHPRLGPLSALLAAPINLDTLDGILRVVRTFRLRRPVSLPARIFTWCGAEPAITPGAVATMDEFWRTKDYVYGRVINTPANILAEARLCQAVAERIDDGVLERFLDYDDRAFEAHLGPELLGSLLVPRDDQDFELRGHAAWGQVLVRVRKRYEVHEEVEAGDLGLPLSAWPRRYAHHKERAHLISRREQLPLPGLFTTLESPEI